MATAIERWERECEEWQAIKDEFVSSSPIGGVTAYVVSLEQRKRMLARGERPVTLEEIQAEHAATLESG